MALTKQDLGMLSRGLSPVIKEYVEQALTPLRERIKELEAHAGIVVRSAPPDEIPPDKISAWMATCFRSLSEK